jgi:hypothetical protein
MIYYFSKNNDISLFISSSIFIILSVYKIIMSNIDKTFDINKYRILLLLLLLIIKYVIDNYNNTDFKLINFALLLYIFLSELEYNINKYILHCEKSNKIINYLKNHNMLDLCKNNVVNFKFCIYLFIIVLTCIYIAYLCGNYNISYKNMLSLGFIITFVWLLIWNKLYIKGKNDKYYNKLFLGNDEWIDPK